ncbi:MAG TPA: hypothetical protein VGL72_19525, partial [Bryobacteraceae bacterium]
MSYYSSYVYIYARVGSVYYQTEIHLSPTAVAQANVAVGITPATMYLAGGQSGRFTASVSGTSNQLVAWAVRSGGGSISNGVYVAPAGVTTDKVVTIAATSLADTTKVASASVTVGPSVTANNAPATKKSVTVTPSIASLTIGQTWQFTAAVVGPANKTVKWTISPTVGTMSQGLYIAPTTISASQMITITATSAVNASLKGTAQVALIPPTPASPTPPPPTPTPTPTAATTSVSPATATSAPGGSTAFSVANLPSGTSVAWSVSPAVGSISGA